jgi:hypothetical protein
MDYEDDEEDEDRSYPPRKPEVKKESEKKAQVF